tara:strand:- start:871 stop:1458 length:588 start_codon:yes stop_codon:yes gene_type:complete
MDYQKQHNMIYIIDDFLPKPILEKLNKYLINFKEVETTHKKFWVMDVPTDFNDWIINKLSVIEGKQIDNIFSFFRVSTDKLDTDWRIHCDSIINNKIPERALILYFSEPGLNELNGTALWEHKELGSSLPLSELSSDKYNNLILNESNKLDNWKLNTVIGYKKNRLISYPSNYFHSKYPNKSWEKGRKVFVMFYK